MKCNEMYLKFNAKCNKNVHFTTLNLLHMYTSQAEINIETKNIKKEGRRPGRWAWRVSPKNFKNFDLPSCLLPSLSFSSPPSFFLFLSFSPPLSLSVSVFLSFLCSFVSFSRSFLSLFLSFLFSFLFFLPC